MSIKNRSICDSLIKDNRLTTQVDPLRNIYLTSKKAPPLYDSFFKSTIRHEIQNAKKSFFT